MPQVMTTNAVVTCPHGGLGQSHSTSLKWRVEGGLVLRENDPGDLSCNFTPRCKGYVLRSMQLNASKLDGARVILVTDFNQSLTGLPLRITEQHHAIDNSTPAPIPTGQQAPPLSPELLDTAAPGVQASPPEQQFSMLTSLPPALIVTFTLT